MAKPIDWLAVTLRFIDPTKTIHDEEVGDHELDVQDPEGVLEGLDAEDLSELEKEIENYLTLETNRGNREYWSVSAAASHRGLGRGSSSSSSDMNRLLTITGAQDHLQRHAPQVEGRARRPQHQLGLG